MSKPLWVYFLLNGDPDPLHSVKVNIGSVTSLDQLYTLAMDKLHLSGLAQKLEITRVFSHEGIEIHRIEELYPDDRLYFSSGEDWVSTTENSPNAAAAPQPQNAGDGYLYTAGLWTTAILSTTYGAFSHAVRTHAPQPVVNSFTTFEDTVNAYSQPFVQSTIPYLSSSVNWTDQMLNQAIVTTTQKTNQFLETPAGQKVSETTVALRNNVADYAAKAVDAFKAATSGTVPQSPTAATTPTSLAAQQNPSPSLGDSQEQAYFHHLQQKIGTDWNDSLVPWAKETFNHIGAQVSQANPDNQNAIVQPEVGQ